MSITGPTPGGPQTTDGFGATKFPGLTDGHYSVTASKDGFHDGSAETDLAASAHQTVQVQIDRKLKLAAPEWLGDGDFDEVRIHLVHRGVSAGDRDLAVLAGDMITIAHAAGDGLATVRIPQNLDTIKVRFTPPGSTVEVERDLPLNPPGVDSDDGLVKRLASLGYAADTDLTSAVRRFQLDFGLDATGEADATTRQKVADTYEKGAG